MFRPFLIALAIMLIETPARAQDPQALMDALIQRQLQQYDAGQQNETMRLELERLNLEEQLRLRRATDSQIEQELSNYCPDGQPPCLRTPPEPLLQEAARRGLIEYTPQPASPQRPAMDCVTTGDGEGGGITDCY